MEYEPTIGLEVHAQLLTHSKIFCSCSTRFGAKPNSQVCPICLGMPGVLPVLNEKVLEYAVRAAAAANCKVSNRSRFARKNYFYPDLPKGYQISQYEEPLSTKGWLEIESNGSKKRIGITRIHIEEDAGKLIHENSKNLSYVDLNRAGVPLIEIVSEPEISTLDEAVSYMKKLRSILMYLGVCDGNMEEGSLRCDANISVRPKGDDELGTKSEIKNINSFKFIYKALEYEIKRHIMLLENGEKVIQETRLFDSNRNVTFSMRSKEEAQDYRYFPDPDLLPVLVEDEWIEMIEKSLPELPDERRDRFVKGYEIPAYDAGVLTASKEIADYFEDSLKYFNKPKVVSNWIMNEVLREIKSDEEITSFKVSPQNLSELLNLVEDGTISGKIAKDVFSEMVLSGKRANEIVSEKGIKQISDHSEIEEIVREVIERNPNEASRYMAGEQKLLGFFIGQVMKASKGKANPKLVNETLKKKLLER
ncbi:Asp-tRNA(Asn)/Glu-tRNA(Gln) amidotransferase subunit GatB [Desulfobacterota bacterium AH_259_B03_O07]|nr:Asp-tRNA(Asn)/Glu-tRNA(Gln) amidotransferase subunit GatB [Desulfobacterota bacterium AH_259_B03_O07]